MAFIKRSTRVEKATIGTRLRKCSQCGRPFVCSQRTNLCPNCIPRTVTENDDGTLTESMPDFNLDFE
ncbi:MAG: hypothetical protein ACXAC5_00350 [Promethearchaeota archaeon]